MINHSHIRLWQVDKTSIRQSEGKKERRQHIHQTVTALLGLWSCGSVYSILSPRLPSFHFLLFICVLFVYSISRKAFFLLRENDLWWAWGKSLANSKCNSTDWGSLSIGSVTIRPLISFGSTPNAQDDCKIGLAIWRNGNLIPKDALLLEANITLHNLQNKYLGWWMSTLYLCIQTNWRYIQQ